MERIPLTLFIHGTHPPDPILNLPPVNRFFRCPKGISKLSELQDSHTKDFLTSLSSKHPQIFPADHCYVFGWSGHLNHTMRKESAHDLYKDLTKLQKEYALRDLKIFLRVITHSHGGNVALCLKSAADAYPESNLTIDELILLACPVQLETADYAKNKLFTKVYSIHSHDDLLQIIDPQGLRAFLEYLKNFGLEFTLTNLKELGPLFSERHFPKYCQVTELNVKYSHRELFHIEFLLPRFMESLPMLIERMQTHTLPDELTHVFSHEDQRTIK